MKWETVELIDRTTPRRTSRVSLSILLCGALVFLGLVAFVVRRVVAPPAHQSPPELTQLVPDKAAPSVSSLSEVSWVSLVNQESVQHQGYVFTYTMSDQAFLELIEWSAEDGRYSIVSTVPVTAGTTIARNVSQIAKERVSAQGAEIYLLVADVGDAIAQTVFVASIDGGVVRMLRMVNREGETRTAVFSRAIAATHSDTFRMEDIDGDGVKEALEEVMTRGANGTNRSEISVYRFKNNVFVYDQDLSIVMNMRGSLFPEPGV